MSQEHRIVSDGTYMDNKDLQLEQINVYFNKGYRLTRKLVLFGVQAQIRHVAHTVSQ